MSNRTWVCLACKRSVRRDSAVRAVVCATCGAACEEVDWKLHIPSPARRKEWDAFWEQLLREKREIARFHADPRVASVELPLLNRRLVRAHPTGERPPRPGKPRRR